MSKPPDQRRPVVVVIDDDSHVREALRGFMQAIGFAIETFASVEAFRLAALDDVIDCLILDFRLPGENGLDFFEDLVRRGLAPPTVFISGHASAAQQARASDAGAVGCLLKPVREQDLADAMERAIARGYPAPSS